MTRGLPRGALLASTILGLPIGLAAPAAAQSTHFERIATFPVYLNLAAGTDPTAVSTWKANRHRSTAMAVWSMPG